MRNVFDQYGQHENRLTHALFASLAHDDRLLKLFIKDVCKIVRPAKSPPIKISVQRYPGGTEYSDGEVHSSSIPDAWIYDDTGWALVFEAKIGAQITSEQLRDHRQKALQLGYDRAEFFCIVAHRGIKPDSGWTRLMWSDVYDWLRSMRTGKEEKNDWAGIAAEYFEVLEAKLMENETLGNGELTTFSGFFSSGNDYSYSQAKAQLIRAIGALRKSKKLKRDLGILRDVPGRSKITDDEDFVWDYLRMRGGEEGNHTENPHLTLGVERRYVSAMVTFPNNLRTPVRRKLKYHEREGLKKLLNKVLDKMDNVLLRAPKAQPMVRVDQRRYPTQSSQPIHDALLDCDLRTVTENNENQPKHQPQWLDAAIDAYFFNNKSNSNLQLQVGVFFEYRNCPNVSTPEAIRLIEDGWVACRPIIDAALEGVR